MMLCLIVMLSRMCLCHSNVSFFLYEMILFSISFHNPKEEITKGYDVVPQLSDDIQLTVDEYRKKLYEVMNYQNSRIQK